MGMISDNKSWFTLALGESSKRFETGNMAHGAGLLKLTLAACVTLNSYSGMHGYSALVYCGELQGVTFI